MNKQGQTFIFVSIMIVAVVFIMVVSLVEPLKDQAQTARTSLDCDNSSISAGEASTCIVTDSYLFAYVGVALGAALALFGFKRLIE